MPVVQVNASAKVEPNRVYVIPPGKQLAAADGHLELAELAVGARTARRGRSFLPHAGRHARAARGGDRSVRRGRRRRDRHQAHQGARRADHRAGPRRGRASGHADAAIATGMVDWVLQVAQMPARLIEYHELRESPRIAAGRRPAAGQAGVCASVGRRIRGGAARSADVSADAHRARLFVLQARDHPAPHRAPHAGQRRRRPAGVSGVSAHQPGRSGRAAAGPADQRHQFLPRPRSVRCAGAQIPALFKGKGPGDSVRVWVPACATGEEAYSIAMLLCEHARALDAPPQIQVFATDLDEDVIETARDGIYPAAIAADVSEERLRRLFLKEVARLSRAPRGARAGAVCAARPAEGLAVFPARSGLLPQPADLPERRCAGARVRHLPLRAATARAPVPRHVRVGRQ